MSVETAIQHRRLGRPTAVALGVLAAALSVGYGVSVGASPGLPYLLASLISAVPVAGVAVMVAERWPRSAVLGLLGLLAFSGAFAAEEVSRSARLVPLNVAVACVLTAGAVLVLTHMGQWRDVLAGLLMTYASAGFIFYFSLL
jgi:hypothetical protein